MGAEKKCKNLWTSEVGGGEWNGWFPGSCIKSTAENNAQILFERRSQLNTFCMGGAKGVQMGWWASKLPVVFRLPEWQNTHMGPGESHYSRKYTNRIKPKGAQGPNWEFGPKKEWHKK